VIKIVNNLEHVHPVLILAGQQLSPLYTLDNTRKRVILYFTENTSTLPNLEIGWEKLRSSLTWNHSVHFSGDYILTRKEKVVRLTIWLFRGILHTGKEMYTHTSFVSHQTLILAHTQLNQECERVFRLYFM